jgi:signal transduction histidine kinase
MEDRMRSSNRSERTNPSAAVLKTAATGTVLIVDDDANLRAFLADCVGQLGLRAIEAFNGPSGLARARETTPDVILLDMHMPLMNGREVLALLKEDPVLQPTPVIVISGVDETDVAADCIAAGADDYLSKPINSMLLRARLLSILDRTRMRAREATYLRQIEAHALELEERVRAKARRLAEAHERLVVLDQAKDEFLSLIAHELRTPVTGAFGASQVLAEDELDDTGRAMAMELLHLSIDRLLRIVEDALLLTRIKVSSDGPALQALPLAPIWSGAAGQASRLATSRCVVIADPEGHGSVLCEATLLGHALVALLESAVKFSEAGGTVQTTFGTTAAGLQIRMEATGYRIPADSASRLFDVLALGGRPITPGGDLGLGPAVAAQILRVLGGSVTVMPTSEGTAFLVTLETGSLAGSVTGRA